jgi:GPH family glycoside/pentoside/hexuronide:cation symporter
MTGTRGERPRLLAFSAPGLGVGFIWGLMSLYFLKFSTDVLLIAPVTIGLLLGLSRVWDGVTDPLVGIWSDRTPTRWGRRRPWLVASALPVAILFVALWSPPAGLEGAALVAWVGGALFLLYAALTAFNIPHKALGAELVDGHHARTRVFAANGIAENVGTLAAAGALGLLETAAAPRDTATTIAAVGGLATAAFIAVCAVRVRERPDYSLRGGTGHPLRALESVARNPHARILLGVFFLELLGHTAFVSALPYVSDYVLDTKGSTSLYLGAALVTTLLSIPLWTIASRRFGKTRAWRASLTAKLFLFAALFGLGPGDLVPALVVSVLYGLTYGCGVAIAPSVKADVIDSDEAHTGERREGLFFSTWNLALKSAIGLSLALSGFVLAASGFVPNAEQEPTAILGILSLVSLVPLACHGAALWLLARFRLDEQEHARIRHEIAARTSAASAQAA